MTKSRIGIERPASGPLPAYDGPTESCWAAGTNTSYSPCASVYRNGSDCETGVVGTVVYWLVPGPKLVAGAPLSPRNTWFHTPLVQLPFTLLLRVKNCCWPALITAPPLNSSSAKNPPLTKPWLQKSWSETCCVGVSFMITRRIGA